MVKRVLFFLVVTMPPFYGMQKNELVGTLLLVGGYYSLIEMKAEQDKPRPNFAYRDKLLYAGIAGHASGMVALFPAVFKSTNPERTAGKFIIGTLCLAKAAHLFKHAHIHHREFLKNAAPAHEKERNMLWCSAGLCFAFGSSMVGWAINDTK